MAQAHQLQNAVWSMMRFLRMDEIIISTTQRGHFLRKALPRSRAYRHEPFEHPVSKDLKILLDRGDYTQWRVYTGELTISPGLYEFVNTQQERFTMIDIGANIGAFTILFARKLKVKEFNVHLFEPNAGVTCTLNENIKRFHAINRNMKAHVNELAVGESEAVLTLKVNDQHTGRATLGTPESYNRTVDVRVVAMDDYVATHNIAHIDLLKIDVEGYEPGVFKGAAKTIARMKPTLYFEYGDAWFENFGDAYVEEVINLFIENGYSFYRETLKGRLLEFPLSTHELKKYKHLNILAVAK